MMLFYQIRALATYIIKFKQWIKAPLTKQQDHNTQLENSLISCFCAMSKC